ncbi:MAG TPA: superoxide dismutase family protein [Opitutaceae bacterium]|nr:superoxide dismutase family protein [Opitutaceae bacterium]
MNTFHSLAPVLRLAGALAAAAFLVNVSLAADDHAAHAAHAHAMPKITAAIAVLQPTQGSEVRGTVRFTQVDGGVRIVADVSGLTPGLHGFHVHEFGDASSADGSAAGGHFNPAHAAHGGPAAAERHAGDFGNLEADTSGHARLDRVDPALSLDGPHSIIGRGLIVHAAPDDLKTQPTGNAGARVACGVIGVAKAP